MRASDGGEGSEKDGISEGMALTSNLAISSADRCTATTGPNIILCATYPKTFLLLHFSKVSQFLISPKTKELTLFKVVTGESFCDI